ncbi:MAG: DUF2844 domain-containing protein [Bdellovibrionales bacterium]|nr:DUF2844 domain-containing protein [Bdellovibrionales bacterium]
MKTLAVVCTGIIVSLLPGFSMATLGEQVSSSAKNLSSLKVAVSAKLSTEKYSVREYEDGGNTVREYADSSGLVFAVGWNGVSQPDLQALFGSYYQEYLDGLKTVPKQYGVKNISLKTTKMSIRRGGRMRDLRGFACVPSLVPEGVNVEELK